MLGIAKVLGLSLFVTLAAALLGGCREEVAPAVWWEGERQRMELGYQLELQDYKLQQSGYGLIGNLEKLRVSNRSDQVRLEALRATHSELKLELESIERELKSFKTTALRQQRRHAVGRTFDTFASSDGRKFHDVSVVSVEDVGVTLRHADGSVRLRYADLDPQQRDFFGLEESVARAAEEQEAREALAYERWIDVRVAAVREKEALARANEERESRLVCEMRVLRAPQLESSQLFAGNQRPLAQPARSVGQGFSRYNYSYRRSRPTYRYVYYNHYRSSAPQNSWVNPSHACSIFSSVRPKQHDLNPVWSRPDRPTPCPP
jgi:hypothetical protein